MDIQISTEGNRLSVTVTYDDGDMCEWSEDIGIIRLWHKDITDELEKERQTVCTAINLAVSNALALRDY